MTDHIADDPKWTEGDAEIISSDGVRFRVPSFYLLAASGVFRDAGEVGRGAIEVEFSDGDIECARTVRMFLELVVHLKLEPGRSDRVGGSPDDGSTLTLRMADDLVALLRFMEKYECAVARDTAVLVLEKRLPEDIHPAAALLAGCAVDEPGMVAAALRYADRGKSDGHYERHEVDEHEVRAHKEDKDTLDPARMPFEFVQRIPPPYLWALGRAWGGRPFPVADRFAEYIKAVKSMLWIEGEAYARIREEVVDPRRGATAVVACVAHVSMYGSASSGGLGVVVTALMHAAVV